MSEVFISSLLAAADRGEAGAQQQLFVALYDELKRIAVRELRRSGGGLPISPTTLLHEAYLDLQARNGLSFPDRPRFLGYASRAMRGLVVDFIRERRAQKRGAGFQITQLNTVIGEQVGEPQDLVELSDALDELALSDAALAQVVDLKYFCGLSFREIAALRDVSERTVQRDWEKARLFLYQSLQQTLPD